MGEIKKQFPLPGFYQFRFKKRLSNSKTVWLDITEDDAMVPEYDGSTMSSPNKSPGRSTNANANVNVNNKEHQTRDSDLLNFDFNSTATTTTTTTTTAAKNNSSSLRIGQVSK